MDAHNTSKLIHALEESESVLASINHSKRHKIVVDDEPCYWQREEWIVWAEEEVLPLVRSALAALRS